MYENFTPVGDRIFVKIIDQEKQTESGLYIPGDMEKGVIKGSVLSVGAEVTTIKVGNLVLLSAWEGTIIDNDYKVIKEELVLGIL